MKPRGIRNNNPLNIPRSADQWQGTATTQTDKSFVQFQSMAYGYRAAWKILDTYCLRFRREQTAYNVRNIIACWAPPSEEVEEENEEEPSDRQLARIERLSVWDEYWDWSGFG